MENPLADEHPPGGKIEDPVAKKQNETQLRQNLHWKSLQSICRESGIRLLRETKHSECSPPQSTESSKAVCTSPIPQQSSSDDWRDHSVGVPEWMVGKVVWGGK
mmetsp:Transcript_3050/g.11737  ORF Transcript_3050/g.11737 Transcript_3050/m.11737 type:complete len:104 (-) Transcript_3050:552-863(-)